MEKEEKQDKQLPRFKRKVSLFRRRKKAEIRPFVREKKQKEYKKYIKFSLMIIVFLFLSSIILIGVRFSIEQFLTARQKAILNPSGSNFPKPDEVLSKVEEKGYQVGNLKTSKDIPAMTFTIQDNTVIYFSLDKNVDEEINALDLIMKQLELQNKKAISVDLRYNKPIVKF